MPDVSRVIIAHDATHAAAAFNASRQTGVPLALQSAPDAIFYAGALYLLRLFEQAQAAFPDVKATCILNCGEAAGEAVSALHTGHRYLRSSAAPEIQVKLQSIAAHYHATLLNGVYEALDLQYARTPENACLNWLRAHSA